MQQHQRQQPGDLHVGQQLVEQATQPNGLGAEVGAGQRCPGRCRIPFVEHQVDHPQHALQACRQFRALRHPIGQLGIADLRLGSHDALGDGAGRRQKARAISSVVRSQTSRRVSATRPSAGKAGWQQVKISRRRSSSISSTSAASAASSSCSASNRSEASKRARRRRASMALKRPVDTSQARGLSGTPSRGIAAARRRRRLAALRHDRNHPAGGSAWPGPDAIRGGRPPRPAPPQWLQ